MLSVIVDVHVHPASVDRAGNGSYLSRDLRDSLLFRLIFWKLGIPRNAGPEEADRRLAQVFAAQTANAPSVDRIVALALDAVHTPRGEVDEGRTRLVVSNDFVFGLAERDPRLVPAVSIHPYRRDAVAELERCAARGARLVKWIPNTQGFAPSEERIRPLYRRAAELRIPFLIHAGPEYSLGSLDQRFGDIAHLRLPLEEGATVIAAHGGGPEIRNLGRPYRPFLEMLRRHPNLYADTSAMCLWTRRRWLLRYLREEGALPKLVHGSDCPIPVSPWVFLDRLPLREVRHIARCGSWIEADYRIKKALGMPREVFERGARLLGLE